VPEAIRGEPIFAGEPWRTPPAQALCALTVGDFFQTGAVATIHRLGKTDVARMERELSEFVEDNPLALVLPCHVREIGTPALRGIIRELANIKYLTEVVVGIDGATRISDWHRARKAFSVLPQRTRLLWNDGPRMQRLFRRLDEGELDPGPAGKGRNVWICFGYVLASERARR